MRAARTLGAVLAAALLLGACGGTEAGEPEASEDGGTETIVVYSGRDEEFVEPLLERFEGSGFSEGVELEVRYGDSAELAATLLEEGDASPADVFFSQDAGSLGAVAEAGLLAELAPDVLELVDERFRSPEGHWLGTSGRARVVAYNTETLSDGDLPDSILGFTDPEWKGRIGFPPTNSSFQAFVAGMIETEGEEATKTFLSDLAANDPKYYEDNSSTVRAIAAGEIDAGFVNHYYIYEVAAEDGKIPVDNHYLADGDPGALVNAAGVGIVAGSEKKDAATEFVRFLLSEEGQSYFAEETWEYPMSADVEAKGELPPLTEIEGPDVDLSDLGGTLQPALTLLADVGIL